MNFCDVIVVTVLVVCNGQMVNETFGDTLFTPGSEALKEFPSPEFLKKRVIISTKPPKEYLEAKKVEANKVDAKENDSQKGKTGSDEEAWGKEVPNLKGVNRGHEKVCVDIGFLLSS